jgi:hypothetical protein
LPDVQVRTNADMEDKIFIKDKMYRSFSEGEGVRRMRHEI